MGVVIRQSLKGTIVTYVGAFLGFLNTLFIATIFLTPEEIGLQRILIEAAILLSGLAQMGVAQAGIRFFPFFKTDDGRHKGFFYYLCLWPLLGLSFFGFLYFILRQPIDRYFSTESALFTDYYFWVFPMTIFMVYMYVFETYGAVLMRITVPRLMREVGLRIFIAGGIVIYGLHYVSLNGFVVLLTLAYGLATLLDLVYAWWLCPPRGGFNPSEDLPKPLRGEMVSYSSFLLMGSLAGLLVARVDIFMVSAEMGLKYTAIYSIAYYMAVIIEMPSRSTWTISSPLVAEAYKHNDRAKLSELYRKVVLNQFLIAGLVFLTLWINIHHVYELMPHGDIYGAGAVVVLFIALAKVVESVSMVGGGMLNLSSHYRYSLLFTVFLGVLSIGTNLWLIPRMGINGAAVATLLTVMVYAIAILSFVGCKIKLHPFSVGMLKVVVVIGLCCGINALWPNMGNLFVDASVRTIVLGGAALLSVYLWKVSPEFNSLLEETCRRVGKYGAKLRLTKRG